MRVGVVVWALSVAFASSVVAQTDSSISTTLPTNSTTSEITGATPSASPFDSDGDAPTASAGINATDDGGSLTFTTLNASLSEEPTATGFTYSPNGGTYYPNGGTYPAAGVAKAPIVAASVGSSAAVSLILIAGVFLCFRRRERARTHVPLEGELDAARRCDLLEVEVRALREQLARVDARQRLSAGRPPPAVQYTNEKDAGAILGRRATKDGPPIYVD
ncbi:hypothetical protein C8R46DRAFT_1096088 [Mycena filopes]|nr:hypothetical protein C8R46DRAFT_1096088 [Mycena filopes]